MGVCGGGGGRGEMKVVVMMVGVRGGAVDIRGGCSAK